MVADRQRARGTDRLLDILDFVEAQDRPLSRNAVAAAIRAPRSTVYSIIDQLLARDYLEALPEGGIVPGIKLGLLGQRHGQHASFLRAARRTITALARELGEVVELNVLSAWKQLILMSAHGRTHNYWTPVEGASFPLPLTASGRFLLRHVSKADIVRHVPAEDFRIADGSLMSADVLAAEIAAARQASTWCARGLIDPYIGTVAAPVTDGAGVCLAVVCILSPLPELDGREAEFSRHARAAAGELSEQLRLSPWVPAGWSTPKASGISAQV